MSLKFIIISLSIKTVMTDKMDVVSKGIKP